MRMVTQSKARLLPCSEIEKCNAVNSAVPGSTGAYDKLRKLNDLMYTCADDVLCRWAMAQSQTSDPFSLIEAFDCTTPLLAPFCNENGADGVFCFLNISFIRSASTCRLCCDNLANLSASAASLSCFLACAFAAFCLCFFV